MSTSHRIAWLDAAKGMTIILVVMMHAALGVSTILPGDNALRAVVDFAQPFRIPVFFFLSGLLLPRALHKPWRAYVDARVMHFAYFYMLWVTIQFAVKAPHMVHATGAETVFADYVTAFAQPFGTLWFIYLLPLFFIIARLAARAPAWCVVTIAAVLEILHVKTGAIVVDEFCARFIYFYAGYILAAPTFQAAAMAWRRQLFSAAFICLALCANGLAVLLHWQALPFLSLCLGLLGTMGLVHAAALLAPSKAGAALQLCGRHSLVIYLSFFLPMAAAREVLIAAGFQHAGLVSAIVTVCAVVVPFGLHALAMRMPFARFLFERPNWARFAKAQ